MRMNLKNKKLKKVFNTKINSKSLFVFLISLFIIAFILGILFCFFISSSDLDISINKISNYFIIKNNYNYFSLFKDNFFRNTFNIFIVWLLGISVIGIIAILIIYFFYIFSFSFSIGTIFVKYGFKGILGSFCFISLSKLFFLILFYFLTFYSFKISCSVIKLCFFKEDIDIRYEIRKYFRFLVFSIIFSFVISLIAVFIDPLFIKLFNTFS